MHVYPTSKRKMPDLAAFKEPPYLLFSFGLFFAFLGAYTPFYYIELFVQEPGIINANLAFYLVAILNSTSTVGRIIANFLADKFGSFNMMVPYGVFCGMLIFTLLSVSSQGPLIAVATLYGFFSGSFVSLSPTILVALSPNRAIMGTRLGMCFAVMGLALLFGAPIAGAIQASYGRPQGLLSHNSI
ncbi:major facilitator superfamily domain-containing protein [Nemania diffusa]|nr:major facilitator superfamily domain-containing protein [Nemania diffusa]